MFRSALLAALLLAVTTASAAAESPRKVVIQGTLSVAQEDDFASGRTARLHTLFDEITGERYTLRFTRPADPRLRSGSRVVVRGTVLGTLLIPDAPLEVVEATVAPGLDARRAVVIVADFADAAVSCTDASIAELMWTGSSSVDGLFQAASFGRLSLTGDLVRVTLPSTTSGTCDPYGWAEAAESAAASAGIELDSYRHKMIVVPGAVGCSWAGLGEIGCGASCRSWVRACDLEDIYAHEIGHNLELAHASTDTNNDGVIDCEYCDTSDIMGFGGVGWRLFNAPHEGQKGWLPTSALEIASPTGTYALSPLQENPLTTPFDQILRIPLATTGDYYYLSYRQRQGYDAFLSNDYTDRTSIHRYAGSGYANSTLVASLQDGEVFDDPANGVQVRQLLHDATSAILQVTTSCVRVAPAIEISPVRQLGRPGQELAYQAIVVNRDSAACSAKDVELAASAPGGFAFDPPSSLLSLPPGGRSAVTLRLTSPASAGDAEIDWSVSADGSTAHALYEVDASAPSAVALSRAPGRTGAIELSWTSSRDNSYVAEYRVMRNGVPIATVAARSYADTKATARGTYDYTVVAVDAVGQASTPSNLIRVAIGAVAPIGARRSARGSR